jgi:hypothetical protein
MIAWVLDCACVLFTGGLLQYFRVDMHACVGSWIAKAVCVCGYVKPLLFFGALIVGLFTHFAPCRKTARRKFFFPQSS